jgi:hypothetical protein
MPGLPDIFGEDYASERLYMISIQACTERLVKELKCMNAVELGSYRRENLPKGLFDTICYLFDPLRQARVNASDHLLNNHFPEIQMGIELIEI